MDSRITLSRTIARKNWTETPTKRKNNKPESIFRDVLREIAPLYGCELIAIPDTIPIKGRKIITHKKPCDDILATSHGNYMIEAKYQNNPLLPHQRETMLKINALNSTYYLVRKKVLKKGTFYTVEQETLIFKTEKIEKIFSFFQDPSNYFNHEIMKQELDKMLPSKKRKLRKVRV